MVKLENNITRILKAWEVSEKGELMKFNCSKFHFIVYSYHQGQVDIPINLKF